MFQFFSSLKSVQWIRLLSFIQSSFETLYHEKTAEKELCLQFNKKKLRNKESESLSHLSITKCIEET